MAIVSNNLKFTLPVSTSGELIISGHALSRSDVTLNLHFEKLSSKLSLEGLVLLSGGTWALPIPLKAGTRTNFESVLNIPQLAGKSVSITVRLPENTPTVELFINQWIADATVFVHGGCVSRDAFESVDAPPLADYRARSSLVSAFDGSPTGVPDIALEANPSEFQRRMLRTDINSELPQLLQETSFDFFLIDLIIERTKLARTSNGGIVTLSPEFIKTGLSSYVETNLDINSQKYFDEFSSAWAELTSIVGEHRLLINRVYWATRTIDGSPVTKAHAARLQNERLDALYSIIESQTPSVRWLNYGNELLRADENHKWGPAPYHFGKAFYRAQRAAIRAAVSGLYPSYEESNGLQTRLGGQRLEHGTDIVYGTSFKQATFEALLSVSKDAPQNSALLRFDLRAQDGSPLTNVKKIPGLIYSHNSDIGWYAYLPTSPGINALQKSISLPNGIECYEVRLRRWGKNSSLIKVLDSKCIIHKQ